MDATTEKMDSKQGIRSFRSIPLAAFQAMKSRGLDLYCLRENDTKPELLFRHQQPITEVQLAELNSRGFDSLLVKKPEFVRVSETLLSSIDAILVDATIPLETRFAILQIAYANEIERLFRKPLLEQYIVMAQKLGKKISTLVQQGQMTLPRLYEAVHHNSLHYPHVTNVAVYALVLAQSMERVFPEDFDNIAVGCLLHEVGELYLPAELKAKKGLLSIRDRQEFEKVPQYAYEALSEYECLTFGQLMMAYQQCERIDGTGYPVRTLAEDIHPWAKLMTIVDIFDSLTNERQNRPVGLRNALLHLADGAKKHFEPEMVLCWITNFQPQ